MEVSRQLIIAAMILSITVWLVSVARRRGLLGFTTQPDRPRHLELMGRLALTPKHSIYLVRAQGRVVLVATHQQGLQVIDIRNSDTAPVGQSFRLGR